MNMTHHLLKLIAPFILALFCFSFTSAQDLSVDLGSGSKGSVGGIAFSIPGGYSLKMHEEIAVMQGPRRNGQFVAEAPTNPEYQYLTKIAEAFTTVIFPDEKGFVWKSAPSSSILRKSKAEKASGDIKGISANGVLVELAYVVLDVKGKTIVTGTGFQVTKSDVPMKELFDQDGIAARSYPDMVVLAHVIASITGEPNSAILPGVFLKARPANP